MLLYVLQCACDMLSHAAPYLVRGVKGDASGHVECIPPWLLRVQFLPNVGDLNVACLDDFVLAFYLLLQ